MTLLRQVAKNLWLFFTFPWRALCDVYFIRIRGRYPVYIYDKVSNVGDCLNIFLIESITGRSVYKIKTKFFLHLLPIGSILHFASRKSVVWGSGLIRKEDAESTRFRNVLALRGALSRDALVQHHDIGNVVLGDPALLLPMFYTPESKMKKYRVGIVPHFSDRNLEFLYNLSFDSVTLIDVSLGEKAFVDRLCECRYIISSSLHGLILADAYGVKNKWAVFSDLVIGGGFKFKDYYSTTDRPNETPRVIRDKQDFEELLNHVDKISSLKVFREDGERLLDLFPRGLNE